MLPKGFVIPVLLVSTILLSVAGCGDDVDPIVLAEEKTEASTTAHILIFLTFRL